MFRKGEHAFIVVSNRQIRQVEVLHQSGGFCTIRLEEGSTVCPGAIRVRKTRLFETAEKAHAAIMPPASLPERGRSENTPWSG